MILALCDKARAAEIIKEDPFYREQLARYQLIDFVASRGHPALLDLIS